MVVKSIDWLKYDYTKTIKKSKFIGLLCHSVPVTVTLNKCNSSPFNSVLKI